MNLRSLLPLSLFIALALFLFIGVACELDDDNGTTTGQDAVADILNQNGTVNLADAPGGLDPLEIIVGVGSTVTFKANGSDAHLIEFSDSPPGSLGEIMGGGSASWTFDHAGVYLYMCNYHDKQNAVRVQ